jgi:hypothetical protein
MSNIDQKAALARIRKMQETVAVVIGSIVVVIMCGYFFSYAQLADRGMSGALWAMGASTIVLVLILFKLKQVSFFFTRLWLGRHAELRDTLAGLHAADL